MWTSTLLFAFPALWKQVRCKTLIATQPGMGCDYWYAFLVTPSSSSSSSSSSSFPLPPLPPPPPHCPHVHVSNRDSAFGETPRSSRRSVDRTGSLGRCRIQQGSFHSVGLFFNRALSSVGLFCRSHWRPRQVPQKSPAEFKRALLNQKSPTECKRALLNAKEPCWMQRARIKSHADT